MLDLRKIRLLPLYFAIVTVRINTKPNVNLGKSQSPEDLKHSGVEDLLVQEEFGAESHQLHWKTVSCSGCCQRGNSPWGFTVSTEHEHHTGILKTLFSLILMELERFNIR